MAFYSMAFLCFIVLFVFLHEFASVFILLMLVFDAAFELDEGTTESMLTKYSGLSDIDTVFVGNSAGEMLDSQLYSEITGDNGFNMCTPPSPGLSVSLRTLNLHHPNTESIKLYCL